MTKKSTNSRMLDEKLKRQVRDTFVFGVLVCITLVLVFLIIRIKKPTRVVSDQVARSEQKLRKLLSTRAELKSMRDQAEQDRNAVDDFLQHCRSADDIPNFEGEHVIAHHNGRTLICYVPAGEHRLEVSAIWRGEPTTAPEDKLPNNEPEKETSWTVALTGNTGYMLEVLTDESSQLLRWELSANNPGIESREEVVSSGFFERAGSVVPNYSTMSYPNQVQRNEMQLRASVYGSDFITEWEKAATASTALSLFGGSWKSTTSAGPATEIRISAKLFSEGPAHVTATDAVSLIGSDLLMPYKGGGKYELRAPE